MLWLVLTIFAMFLFALIGVIQGAAIKKFSINGRIYLFYTMFLQGALGCLTFLFKPIFFHGFFFASISILSGFFFVYGLLPYMKSIEFEEVSRMNPLFNLSPIFVLILSLILLNTGLSSSQLIGFVFLLIGGFLISIKKIKGTIKLSRGFWYMVLTNLILGFYFIATDYLFKNYDYWSSFAFVQLGILIAASSLILFRNYSINKTKNTIKLKRIALIFIFTDAVLSIFAVALRNVAIKLSSATIVTSFGGIQSLFVLIITLLVSFKFSAILKEETSKKTIILKMFSIALLILGIYFIVN